MLSAQDSKALNDLKAQISDAKAQLTELLEDLNEPVAIPPQIDLNMPQKTP